MKILITGGAGFIGSNFIRHILRTYSDYEVINLDSLTYAGNLENLTDVEHLKTYSFVKGNICDRQLVERLDFDAIVNFAAESHVDRSILDAYPFLQTNILGTQTLLEIAGKRKCRILHVSTDEVYGSTEKGLFTEESPLMPNSPYAASKASADMLCRAYHKTFGLDVIITRCSNNYGPYQFPEKLIPLVILNMLEDKPVPVYGDGKNIRDWIYASDHCRAVDMVLHKGRAGEVYNIGARNEIENIHIIEKLLMIIAGQKGRDVQELEGLIRYVQDRPGHDRRYAIDPSKIENELGWRPERSFEDALSSTVTWYLSNRHWWSRIITGEYKTYYQMQYGERIQK